MKGRLIRTAFLLSLLCSVASAFPRKPDVEGPVADYAGLFSPAQRASLWKMLKDFSDTTSNRICVVTVTDLEGYDVSEYAIRLGREWGVGSSEHNNGIVFLIKPKPDSYTQYESPERQSLASSLPSGENWGDAFIAVGRGLEGAIPDIYAHRIVNNVAIPRFAEGDYYAGVYDACTRLMALAVGEYSEMSEEDDDFPGWVIVALFLIFIVVLVVISVLSKHSGGSGGGSGSSFGGGLGPRHFGGFGGRGSSGGFGGRGGFTGGFGGGSFGGGGAGGRW